MEECYTSFVGKLGIKIDQTTKYRILQKYVLVSDEIYKLQNSIHEDKKLQPFLKDHLPSLGSDFSVYSRQLNDLQLEIQLWLIDIFSEEASEFVPRFFKGSFVTMVFLYSPIHAIGEEFWKTIFDFSQPNIFAFVIKNTEKKSKDEEVRKLKEIITPQEVIENYLIFYEDSRTEQHMELYQVFDMIIDRLDIILLDPVTDTG